MKLFIFPVVLAATVVMAGSVGAATLNFVAYAEGNEGGVADGTGINFSGTNVNFSATYSGDPSEGNAYFDEGGGLGVCHTGLSNGECNVPSDDNVTADETLTIAFNSYQTLSGLLFNAEGHIPLFDDTLTLLFGINGGELFEYTFAELGSLSFDNVLSATFSYGGSSQDQFYLAGATVAAIPVPAAGLLLLGGLALLGLVRRQRASAAA